MQVFFRGVRLGFNYVFSVGASGSRSNADICHDKCIRHSQEGVRRTLLHCLESPITCSAIFAKRYLLMLFENREAKIDRIENLSSPIFNSRFSILGIFRKAENAGVPNGIRTRVIALKERCPRPLDDGDAHSKIGNRKVKGDTQPFPLSSLSV